MVEFTVRSDRSTIANHLRSLVHVLVEVRTPPAVERPRLPLNLGLVIDRSGSMAGAKLAATRAALRNLLRRLGSEDRVSLVTYDHTVQVLDQGSGADKQRLIRKVDELRPGGNTNLSGGWLEGLAQVQRGRSAGGLDRVLLLTDGQANAGVTDRDALAEIGRRHLALGLRTTTLGFGADYDEDLLTRIADESGGNAYYIETPDQAAGAFLQELGELGDVVGQNLELVVGCEPGVTLIDATDFPGKRDEREALFRVGDLYADDVTCVVLTLSVEPGLAGEQALLSVGMRYRDVGDGGVERRDARLLTVQRQPEPGPVVQDPDVMREVLLHKAARAKAAAVALADRGRLEDARTALTHELDSLTQALDEGTVRIRDRELLQSELTQSRSLREDFREETYSALTRKQAIMQSHLARKKRGIYSSRTST